METFWMVWSPQGNAPTFRHMTLEQAEQEAERLFRLNPGSDFYVLQAVAKAEWAPDVRPVRLRQLQDIPF